MKCNRVWLVSFVFVLMATLCLAIIAYPVAADSPLTVVHVPGDAEWVDSGIYINANTGPVAVDLKTEGAVITGRINVYGIGSLSGPAGQEWICFNQPDSTPAYYCAMEGEPWGKLIGKIGSSGDSFAIGNANSIEISTSGELYLAVNDYYDTYYDNLGEFTVLIYK